MIHLHEEGILRRTINVEHRVIIDLLDQQQDGNKDKDGSHLLQPPHCCHDAARYKDCRDHQDKLDHGNDAHAF